LQHDRRQNGTCDRVANHVYLQGRVRADEVRLCGRDHGGAVRPAPVPHRARELGRWRQCRRGGARLMRRGFPWARHAVLVLVSIVMLLPFYWVLKTAITDENIYTYPPRLTPLDPHLFNFVDVWYLIPFPRYLLNSVIVSAIAVAGNVVLNALAGY